MKMPILLVFMLLSLISGVAAIGKYTGRGAIDTYDYEGVYASILAKNSTHPGHLPVTTCDIPYGSLNLARVIAMHNITSEDCGQCVQVCGFHPRLGHGCQYLVIVDVSASKKIVVSTGASQAILHDDALQFDGFWYGVDMEACIGIWNGTRTSDDEQVINPIRPRHDVPYGELQDEENRKLEIVSPTSTVVESTPSAVVESPDVFNSPAYSRIQKLTVDLDCMELGAVNCNLPVPDDGKAQGEPKVVMDSSAREGDWTAVKTQGPQSSQSDSEMISSWTQVKQARHLQPTIANKGPVAQRGYGQGWYSNSSSHSTQTTTASSSISTRTTIITLKLAGQSQSSSAPTTGVLQSDFPSTHADSSRGSTSPATNPSSLLSSSFSESSSLPSSTSPTVKFSSSASLSNSSSLTVFSSPSTNTSLPTSTRIIQLYLAHEFEMSNRSNRWCAISALMMIFPVLIIVTWIVSYF